MLNSMISLDPEIIKFFKNNIIRSIPVKYAKTYLLLYYKYWVKYKLLVRLFRGETERQEPNSII